jgi:hypothetical protein
MAIKPTGVFVERCAKMEGTMGVVSQLTNQINHFYILSPLFWGQVKECNEHSQWIHFHFQVPGSTGCGCCDDLMNSETKTAGLE